MAPTLEEAFTLRCYLDGANVAVINQRLTGLNRVVGPLNSGTIKFAQTGIEAKIKAPGADWLLMDDKNKIAHIDVRLRATTDEGEIYLHYTGRTDIDEAAAKFLSFAPDARSTQFGESDWIVIPTMETSDERLRGLEKVQLLGQGRWVIDEVGRGIEYAVYVVKS